MATEARRLTREVRVGNTVIGGKNPVVIQTMCATHTTNIPATLAQIQMLEKAGAELIRVAVDSTKDVEALREIRKETKANLVVDLQENYRLAKDVAPFVEKFRYNPGHLHHHERNVAVVDKVKFLVDVAGEHDCAIRIGVNFGSLDPKQKQSGEDSSRVALNSSIEHCDMLESLGFTRYVVSLKSSDPFAVMELNREFAAARPLVPLHLGVTEAGLLPDAEIKSRAAFEPLLADGIGETLRVSITVPDEEKFREVEIGRQIVEDVRAGRFSNSAAALSKGLNVISCPSCSRTENHAFVKLAEEVKKVLNQYRDDKLTVAVMGCRVNGPGETDHADLGLWCAASYVNLKRGTEVVGAFKYDEVLPVLLKEAAEIVARRRQEANQPN